MCLPRADSIAHTNALFPECTVLSGDAELINALAFRVSDVVSNDNVLIVRESLWSTKWTIDTSMKATWADCFRAKTTDLSSGMLVHSSDTNMKAIDAALYLTTTDGTPHLVLLQSKYFCDESRMTDGHEAIFDHR